MFTIDLPLFTMCKYTIGGLETVWPSVGYNELVQYNPVARTYLIGWRSDNPLFNYALSTLLMAGYDKGFYHRRPMAVGDGSFQLFLVDVAEVFWIDKFADLLRVLCDTQQCCYSPFNRASVAFKAESKQVLECLRWEEDAAIRRNHAYDACKERGLR